MATQTTKRNPTVVCRSSYGQTGANTRSCRESPQCVLWRAADGLADAKKPTAFAVGFFSRNRRRPTLPGGCPPSTIGADGLDFRVRNGNGYISVAMSHRNYVVRPQKR